MEVAILVLLSVLSISLLLLEIFLIPGVTVAGIIGGLIMIAGFIGAIYLWGLAPAILYLVINLVVLGLLIYYFIKSKAIDRIALKKELEGGLEQPLPSLGDRGVAISRMNLYGTVFINGVEYEAKAESEYIDEGTGVVVTVARKGEVIVRKWSEE